MEWIADPSIWAGLITLIVIELVLGIDNLVFIAILAEKTPTGATRPCPCHRAATGDGHAPATACVYLLAGYAHQSSFFLPRPQFQRARSHYAVRRPCFLLF